MKVVKFFVFSCSLFFSVVFFLAVFSTEVETDIAADAVVDSYSVSTDSLITVYYSVTNPYNQVLNDVGCTIDPKVSMTSVADGFGEGVVSLPPISSGETHRAKTDISIESFQAGNVSDVMISCNAKGDPADYSRLTSGFTPDTPETVLDPRDSTNLDTSNPSVNPTADVTVSQTNALRKAQAYLDYTAFSKTSLMEQLIFEGFSGDDAAYAVEHVPVDWNQQAALKAKAYLEYTAFSRSSLREQLLFEGYTSAEADFGVSSTGL